MDLLRFSADFVRSFLGFPLICFVRVLCSLAGFPRISSGSYIIVCEDYSLAVIHGLLEGLIR